MSTFSLHMGHTEQLEIGDLSSLSGEEVKAGDLGSLRGDEFPGVALRSPLSSSDRSRPYEYAFGSWIGGRCDSGSGVSLLRPVGGGIALLFRGDESHVVGEVAA